MNFFGQRIRVNEDGRRFLLRLFLGIFIAAFIFSTARFFIQRQKLLDTRDRLIALIEEQQTLSKLYEEELSRVGTPEYYEYMARKYFGYIYPDETILIVTNGEESDE